MIAHLVGSGRHSSKVQSGNPLLGASYSDGIETIGRLIEWSPLSLGKTNLRSPLWLCFGRTTATACAPSDFLAHKRELHIGTKTATLDLYRTVRSHPPYPQIPELDSLAQAYAHQPPVLLSFPSLRVPELSIQARLGEMRQAERLRHFHATRCLLGISSLTEPQRCVHWAMSGWLPFSMDV